MAKKYDQILDESHKNIQSLQAKINELEELRRSILEIKDSNSELPLKFSGWYDQFVEVNKEYRKVFESANSKYVEANNAMFAKNMDLLQQKANSIEEQIASEKDKLSERIKLFLSSVSGHTKKLDEKIEGLQGVNVSLKNEVERLSQIDLEAHFKQHNKALSDISGSINLVNTSIGGAVSNIQTNYQELVNLKNDVASTGKDILKRIESNQSQVESRIADLSNTICSIQEELIKANNANNTKLIILIVIGVLAVIATVAMKFIKDGSL